MTTVFVFDASAWVGAWRELYAPDVFPRLWQQMADAIARGIIASPRQTMDEIAAKDDELKAWMAPHRKALAEPLGAHDKEAEAEAMVAQLCNTYPNLATRSGADYYVIAWAKLLGTPLVATENPRATAHHKMAGICRTEKLAYLFPLQFMQSQKWCFA